MLRGRWRRTGRELNVGVDGAPHRRLNPLSGRMGFGFAAARAEAMARGNGTRSAFRSPFPMIRRVICARATNVREGRAIRSTRDVCVRQRFSGIAPPTQGTPAKTVASNEGGLLMAAPEAGICRVMCFSPRHDLSIPSMELEALRGVVETWCSESAVSAEPAVCRLCADL